MTFPTVPASGRELMESAENIPRLFEPYFPQKSELIEPDSDILSQ